VNPLPATIGIPIIWKKLGETALDDMDEERSGSVAFWKNHPSDPKLPAEGRASDKATAVTPGSLPVVSDNSS
jgi:hypothetical protein